MWGQRGRRIFRHNWSQILAGLGNGIGNIKPLHFTRKKNGRLHSSILPFKEHYSCELHQHLPSLLSSQSNKIIVFPSKKMKKLLCFLSLVIASNTLRIKEETKSALSYTTAAPRPKSRIPFRFGVEASSVLHPKIQTGKMSRQKRIAGQFARRLKINFLSSAISYNGIKNEEEKEVWLKI